MHPDFEKYKAASAQLHEIWGEYASALESVALDEAYLDVTDTAGSFEKAREFARAIKQRTQSELGLSCSVGSHIQRPLPKRQARKRSRTGISRYRQCRALWSLSSTAMSERFIPSVQRLPEKPVRLIGAGIFDLSDNENRQLSFDDIEGAGNDVREQSLTKALDEIGGRYNLDFAGNLEKIYRSDILHKTVEHMRKHSDRKYRGC